MIRIGPFSETFSGGDIYSVVALTVSLIVSILAPDLNEIAICIV